MSVLSVADRGSVVRREEDLLRRDKLIFTEEEQSKGGGKSLGKSSRG